VAWTAPALAEIGAEPEPIRLIYTTSDGCPSREAFLGRLRARTTRFREAIEGEPARDFTIELAFGADASRGKLTVRARDGSSATRVLKAPSCEQVGAAVALVIAIAIDPQALVEVAPPKSEPEPPPVPPPVPSPPPDTARPPDVRSAEPMVRTRVALGLRWDEVSGVTPILRPVLRPFFEIIGDRQGVFVPGLRVSFAWTHNARVGTAYGEAEFSWYVGRVEACPFRLGSVAASVSSCVTFDAGAQRVVGQNAPADTAQTRPWVSTGLNARGSARLWRSLFVEVEVGAAAPWIKDRWLFADGSEIHATPPISAWLGAGLGCRFP
jgi:hypothetical protein